MKNILCKEDLHVGLFFYVNNDFIFSGCCLKEAQSYGDFMIYPESHYDIWDKIKAEDKENRIKGVDYDYYPRGRVVYRKSDDTFIIYYDKCVMKELDRLSKEYEGYNVKYELDEHYCCHKCNPDYCF